MAEQNASSNRSSGDYYYINASSTGSSGDYYINASSNRSSGVDYINGGIDYEDGRSRQMRKFYSELWPGDSLIIRIILANEIPIMILTLFALCALIKSHRSTPVFVIHLILSDLIQIISKLMETTTWSWQVNIAYAYSLIVGLYFMACVAFERYLLVSHPIWYRSHHSLKVCCGVSVIIWFIPLIIAIFTVVLLIFADIYFSILPLSIGCLIPYLIIILCFVGTCRGLSRTISLTSLQRKKILGSLFLVLLTYTFLVLPFILQPLILNNFYGFTSFNIFWYLSRYLLLLNPLADCVLYMFLRPDVGGLMKSVHCCCRTDVGGLMKSVHCCCRTDTHQSSTHSRDEHSRDSSAAFACCVSMQKPVSHSQTACSSV